jgi:DNA-binding transcriptional MerR regulator
MAKERGQPKLWRIGEVSRRTGVNPHTLRYWEAEFQILSPNRRLSKQRLYRQADIDLILEIKRLLQEEKYTLAGVRQYLTARQARPGADPAPAAAETPEAVVHLLRRELQALRAVLAAE